MQPAALIDKQIASYSDWRGKVMSHLRTLIHDADPEIVEEWKWDTAVYTQKGMVCAVSAFKGHVKMNFFKGAKLQDKHRLLNSGFTSKSHRAIDFSEGDTIKEAEIKDLIREAISLNITK